MVPAVLSSASTRSIAISRQLRMDKGHAYPFHAAWRNLIFRLEGEIRMADEMISCGNERNGSLGRDIPAEDEARLIGNNAAAPVE